MQNKKRAELAGQVDTRPAKGELSSIYIWARAMTLVSVGAVAAGSAASPACSAEEVEAYCAAAQAAVEELAAVQDCGAVSPDAVVEMEEEVVSAGGVAAVVAPVAVVEVSEAVNAQVVAPAGGPVAVVLQGGDGKANSDAEANEGAVPLTKEELEALFGVNGEVDERTLRPEVCWLYSEANAGFISLEALYE